MNKTNISKEYQIFRMDNGVLLVPPDERQYKHMPIYHDLNKTVDDALTFPCNIYFSDTQHRYQLVNEFCAEICGFDSPTSALNKWLHHTSTLESSNIIYRNNLDVFNKKKLQVFDEVLTLNNGTTEQGVTIKLPWYNIKKEIIGLFGLTIVSGKQPLGKILNQVAGLGLLNIDNPPLADDNGFDFTKREKEIIYLLQKNKTAKQISHQLYISPRTVEKHIENIKIKIQIKIKIKMNVKSRTDIVDILVSNSQKNT